MVGERGALQHAICSCVCLPPSHDEVSSYVLPSSCTMLLPQHRSQKQSRKTHAWTPWNHFSLKLILSCEEKLANRSSENTFCLPRGGHTPCWHKRCTTLERKSPAVESLCLTPGWELSRGHGLEQNSGTNSRRAAAGGPLLTLPFSKQIISIIMMINKIKYKVPKPNYT